jgi:hypothetical protein
MKYNIFATPILIDQIDLSQIKLDSSEYKATFPSQVSTSFYGKNILSPSSSAYLLNKIAKNLNEVILHPYELHLKFIWRNNYTKDSFQEKHIHAKNHFSFIIYEKIDKGHTVFSHPVSYLLESMYDDKGTIFPVVHQPQCKTGDLLIFPSYLEHYVEPCSNGTTISGNLGVTFK